MKQASVFHGRWYALVFEYFEIWHMADYMGWIFVQNFSLLIARIGNFALIYLFMYLSIV
jgi:hypothetical protein